MRASGFASTPRALKLIRVSSSYNPKTIYYGGNYLFVSHDRGDGWTALGPDLTTGQDRGKLPGFRHGVASAFKHHITNVTL